jgi:hypothetical protein
MNDGRPFIHACPPTAKEHSFLAITGMHGNLMISRRVVVRDHALTHTHHTSNRFHHLDPVEQPKDRSIDLVVDADGRGTGRGVLWEQHRGPCPCADVHAAGLA